MKAITRTLEPHILQLMPRRHVTSDRTLANIHHQQRISLKRSSPTSHYPVESVCVRRCCVLAYISESMTIMSWRKRQELYSNGSLKTQRYLGHHNAHLSPFDPKKGNSTKSRQRRPAKSFIPRKAAVQLTENARNFFRTLLAVSKSDIIGIILKYRQSSSGEPRMVFAFDFVRVPDIHPDDEGVSLEINKDGTPKSPAESVNDGLPKLYIDHGAFLKALGCTVDVDPKTMVPILYDREGNRMDPNA